MDERRHTRVLIETDRHRIVGDLTLPRDGYLSRLSDFLNQDATFLAVTNASVETLAGGEHREIAFIAVARAHVRVALPIENE